LGLIEIIAVIATLSCVYLTTRQNIWCWLAAIIGGIGFFILFWQQELFAQMSLQVVYILQGGYGWYNWSKKGNSKVLVRKLSASKLSLLLVGCLLLSIVFGHLLDTTTESTAPYLDAITTFLSLLANWFLTRKIWQSWHIWILVNISLSTLFFTHGLYLSAIMEIILLGLSINGLILWKRDLKTV
jgi:nicotinamide mononucleotide transporter